MERSIWATRAFDGSLIVLFLILTFLLGAFPLKDADIYWHLRNGRSDPADGEGSAAPTSSRLPGKAHPGSTCTGFFRLRLAGCMSGVESPPQRGQVRDHVPGDAHSGVGPKARVADRGDGAGVAARALGAVGRIYVRPGDA